MVNMSEHQRLYSPSQWSKRFSPEKVIENYLKIIGEGMLVTIFCLSGLKDKCQMPALCRRVGSQWALSHLNSFTYKLTQNANEEEVIQFFYKSPQSFSLEADGSLNFHGKINWFETQACDSKL